MSDTEARQAAPAVEDMLSVVRGSASYLAILALLFVAGLGVLAVLSAASREPLVLTVMAVLATVGLFFLFGMAAGHLQLGERATDTPLVKSATDALSQGLCIMQGRRALYANTAFTSLTGRTMLGEPKPLETVFAEDSRALQALFQLTRAAERGEAHEEEFWTAGTGGDTAGRRCYRISVVALGLEQGDGGPVRPALWSVADVTDKRLKETEDHKALEATLACYEALQLGVFVASDEGRVAYLNSALAGALGFGDPDQAAGLEVRDLLSVDCAALIKATLASGSRTAQPLDLDFVREDGRIWPASLIAVAHIDDGRHKGFAAAVTARLADVHPSQKAEAEGRQRLAPLIKGAPFGIATIDREGRVVSANPAFARLLLDGSAGAAGRDATTLTQDADASARQAFAAAQDAALQGKANIAPVEITLGNNREFARRIYYHPLFSASASKEAAILYVIDATEEKALERKFVQSQKMEAVGKLAGGIAHDFNNVLTAIIGFSELLLLTHRPADPAYKNISAIKSSANRAAGLVRHLLAFSRRQTLQPEVLELGEVLTDLSMMLNRLLGEKVELKVHAARDLWQVKADPEQLSSAIVNLAVNARHAMPEGGRLSIKARNVSERESARLGDPRIAPADYVGIHVEDTGSGMTEDVMANVFEPFFTTKGVGEGTGLGLSMVYGFIKQTGGYVFVESAPGKGTTFKIYLPRHIPEEEDETVAAVERPRKEERQGDLTGNGRVLLVEDEDAVRSFAFEALRRQGYDVLCASTGVEALDVMARAGGHIDLVVSDVIMPEMDGPTLLRELRKTRPELKVILVSGYPDTAFKGSLEPNTEFAFLPKPFTLAQLAAKVKQELGR